jgi:hypothetical protein
MNSARLVALVVAGSLPGVGAAAEYCVSTPAELATALEEAAGLDAESDVEIKLVAGDYDGSFTYVARQAFNETPAIGMSGGWTTECTATSGDFSTIVGDLVFTGPEYPTYPANIRDLTISGQLVTRTDGAVSVRSTTVGSALDIGCCVGGLTIERSTFRGQDVEIVTSGTADSMIRDSLFGGSLTYFSWIDLTRDGRVGFRGNTVHFFESTLPPPHFWLTLEHDDSVAFEMRRNVITFSASNSYVTLDLDYNDNFISGPRDIGDNWIGVDPGHVTAPTGALAGSGNVVEIFPLPYANAEPPFDFHLAAGSPQIDYSFPTTDDAGDHDLDGYPRVMNAMVDVGAYETFVDLIFRSAFESAQ